MSKKKSKAAKSSPTDVTNHEPPTAIACESLDNWIVGAFVMAFFSLFFALVALGVAGSGHSPPDHKGDFDAINTRIDALETWKSHTIDWEKELRQYVLDHRCSCPKDAQ